MSSPTHRLRTTPGGCNVVVMEQQIDWPLVAERVRNLAETKVNEAKERYPFLAIQGAGKKAVERALGLSHGQVFDARWNGKIPYTLSQLAVIADLFGVRVADLLMQDD